MENKVSYKLRPSIMKIMMEDCFKVYTSPKNHPESLGRKMTYDEMFEEVVTFYRDADGWIIRGKKQQ